MSEHEEKLHLYEYRLNKLEEIVQTLVKTQSDLQKIVYEIKSLLEGQATINSRIDKVEIRAVQDAKRIDKIEKHWQKVAGGLAIIVIVFQLVLAFGPVLIDKKVDKGMDNKANIELRIMDYIRTNNISVRP